MTITMKSLEPAASTLPGKTEQTDFKMDLTTNGIVATIFFKTPIQASQWTEESNNALVRFLDDAFTSHSPQRLSSQTNWPDRSASTSLCRVMTLHLPCATSPTLRECHQALTQHSDALSHFETSHSLELTIHPYPLLALHKSSPGLAVFDMDSTLIQQEVIDELARAVGKYSQVAAITEAAMRGEAPYTDFEASLRARVGLLKGVPVSIWEDMKRDVITFTPGARELVKVLRAKGWKTAVLSGGFTPLARWVARELGLDDAFANHLVEDAETGTLTGELVEGKPIVHAQKKQELLRSLAEGHGIPLERTIAVGDGSNDLLMMAAAGLGVAFNAKPKVQTAAPTRINGESLLDVAYLLGCTREEIDSHLRAALSA